MALFGSIKGIVQLNLGSISTFQVGQRFMSDTSPSITAPLHAPVDTAQLRRLPACMHACLPACPASPPCLPSPSPLPRSERPQEVVIGFHKAPKRWWKAGTSDKGKKNLFV